MKPRNAAIDHIRIILTALVILHHTAIAYGGSGGWYWREVPNFSNMWLVSFNAINQSFFMGFLFLLSGYYSAMSLEQKNVRLFLRERFLRLGLPMLGYFFLLSPLTVALATAENLNQIGSIMLWRWQHFELGAGPLWFAEALLIFSVLLVVLLKLAPGLIDKKFSFPGFPALLAMALAIGVISFIVRLFIPVGENVLWLQLGYFPCYIFLFYAGYMAWGGQVLESIEGRQVFPWAILTLIGIAVLPLALAGFFGEGQFEGGLSWNAIFYALWDPLTGFGIILFMLWAFRLWWAKQHVVSAFLARRAYAVYIVHPPVVVSCSLLMKNIGISPEAKFFIVGLLAMAGSVLVATVLMLIPKIKRVI